MKLIEQNLVHLPTLSFSNKINMFIHILGIVIKIGRYFSIISICLTGLNFILAVNDFFGNNIGFGVINSVFVVSGLVFDTQSHVIGWIQHKTG